ncbi:MAG TPA: hypothetical protein VKG84_07280 [Candidatus Acidoferrales bacterium]|nr:hypothetical protein [Candidatus Acidoferrales bacterium]
MRTATCTRGFAMSWMLAAAVLVCAAVALPAAQAPAVENFERTVPLQPGGSFSLSNVNGSIEIEGWDRDEVYISARKYSTRAAEDLGQVDISVLSSAGSVAVATRYPEGSGVEVNVEFHVRVPARVLLASVTTVNGSVAVHDVSGAGSLAAVNGSVMLARSAGMFSAHATNGNVSLELLSLDGALAQAGASDRAAARRGISAQTVNGQVTVALPADAGAELEARTQNGDFVSDLPLLARSSAAAGRVIRGRVGSGGLPVYLRTVNGSIRLRITRPLV